MEIGRGPTNLTPEILGLPVGEDGRRHDQPRRANEAECQRQGRLERQHCVQDEGGHEVHR